MTHFEWHTAPLIGTGATMEDARRPDLSGIPGATGAWASAIENGSEMFLLVEVDDGQ